MARIAKSLNVLRDQINKAYPKRNKVSDGWIGDTSHSARKSDHNPNTKGVVQALDLTHDPRVGFDSYKFADHLRTTKDPRIKYVISNGRIWTPSISPDWRKYTGSNPHSKHVHVSVGDSASSYDSPNAWDIGTVGTAVPSVPKTVTPPVLRKGSKGQDVRNLQSLLRITVDGDFGPATEKAVKAFQKTSNLAADGIVGVYTWEALKKATSGATTTPVTEVPSSVPTEPKKSPEIALAILLSLGWAPHQAAAIVGHAQQESYLDLRPHVVGDGGSAFGIIQWRLDRFDNLKKFAASRGKPWEDFETQVRFINKELRGSEKFAGNKLLASKDVEQAVEALMHYVRSAGYSKTNPRNGHGFNNRLRNAQALMQGMV
jgi:hypothetical protein